MKMYVNMKKCMLILNRMDHGGYGCAKRIKCEEEREKEHEEGRRARKHMRKVPLRENVNKKKKRGGTSTTISMEGGGPGILGTNDTPPPSHNIPPFESLVRFRSCWAEAPQVGLRSSLRDT
jgi:hypothetical protein